MSTRSSSKLRVLGNNDVTIVPPELANARADWLADTRLAQARIGVREDAAQQLRTVCFQHYFSKRLRVFV